MRHEHSCNRPSINAICLGLTKAEAFPKNVGVQWVNDKGVQAVVEKEPEDVVTVVSCSLKPYFYFVWLSIAGTDTLQQSVKTFSVIGNGKYISQDFSF